MPADLHSSWWLLFYSYHRENTFHRNQRETSKEIYFHRNLRSCVEESSIWSLRIIAVITTSLLTHEGFPHYYCMCHVQNLRLLHKKVFFCRMQLCDSKMKELHNHKRFTFSKFHFYIQISKYPVISSEHE